jgi:hypothetical protein
VQVGQFGDLAGVERAALTLLGRGPTRVPHEVVGDQLPAPFERLQQGERSIGPDQLEAGVYLDHGQAPPGRGDRVTFAGVRLLPRTQLAQFGLEGVPVGGHGAGRRAVRRAAEVR